jgi:hypothetical protein
LRSIFFILFLYGFGILFSCTESIQESQAKLSFKGSDGKIELLPARLITTKQEFKDKKGKTISESLNYSTSVIDALEFIKKRGEFPKPSDVKELVNESVIILEIESENSNKSILDSKRLTKDRNDVNQYIVGDMLNDIWVLQNSKEIHPTGNNYENSFGSQNKMRTYFFFNGINKNEPFKIVYNDKLFGSGILNFGQNKNIDL